MQSQFACCGQPHPIWPSCKISCWPLYMPKHLLKGELTADSPSSGSCYCRMHAHVVLHYAAQCCAMMHGLLLKLLVPCCYYCCCCTKMVHQVALSIFSASCSGYAMSSFCCVATVAPRDRICFVSRHHIVKHPEWYACSERNREALVSNLELQSCLYPRSLKLAFAAHV